MHLQRTSGLLNLILRDDLSPEDVAMLQALYSRSGESVAKHLAKIDAGRRDAVRDVLKPDFGDIGPDVADEVLAAVLGQGASARAGSFMSSFYVGYNHKSIGDCGTTTLFIEGVSLLAAKAIQDNPLYSGQETSTRYIDMAARPIVDPVGTPASRAILDRWMGFYVAHQDDVALEIRARHPRREGEDEVTYERAVKARTFDVMRGWLPAGITTQLSWHTNLRQAGDKLATIQHHPAREIAGIGKEIHALLAEAYPASAGSIGAAQVSGVSGNTDAEGWHRLVATMTANNTSLTNQASFSTSIDPMLLSEAGWINDRPRGCVLPHFLSDLGQVTFRFNLDYGSFRDVQRQRNGVCRMPLLDLRLGMEPWYIEQLPLHVREAAHDLISHQTRDICALRCGPFERQYYIPIGYRVPCKLTYGLPAAVYVMELRSGKTVHPTLRKVVHRMIADFCETFPALKLHVDLDPDDWTVRRGKQTITERTS